MFHRRQPRSWDRGGRALRPPRRLLALLLAGAFLAGCSPLYVMRAGYEEARILWRRRPIGELLADPTLDPATREKFDLVLAVRGFAEELGLRVGGSYASFARIDAEQVVHVVSAAHRLRLEPYTWWFPVVGRMPYKGYFRKESAEEEARALERRGLDAIVLPSAAFSTLGWFDDPLLSNLLRHDRVVLANVVLHELTHNTFYPAGQAGFNESFANFVGCRGAIAFFAAREGGDAAGTARARQLWDDARTFSAFLEDFAGRLREAYAAGMTLEQRQAFFLKTQEDFRSLAFATNAYADFGRATLNNALILHQLVYHRALGDFEAVFHREHGDLRAAITRVVELADGAEDPFAALRAFAAGSPVAARRAPSLGRKDEEILIRKDGGGRQQAVAGPAHLLDDLVA